MRMIGIGLVGFLLAGVALLLSTMNVLEQGKSLVQAIATGPHLVFENRMSAPTLSEAKTAVLRSNPDHPVILSGFPAYQSIAFSLPKDARPTSGYLQIDVTAQALQGVEGVLRISIRNSRRGDLLLRPGELRRSLHIPLSPSDLADDSVVVSFSLQGSDLHQKCGPEDGIAAIVEVETTSALHLTLDRPLVSARDRFHIWGDVLRVAWPSWLNREEQTRRLILAAAAKQDGLATHFRAAGLEEALNTVALREVLSALPDEPTAPAATPHLLAAHGANAGVRRFHRTTVWRSRYAMNDGSGDHIPSHIDLRMAFGGLPGGAQWSLIVTLNNRLIGQYRHDARQTDLRTLVALPAVWQGKSNQLEVILSTTAPFDGPCDQGPELVAEMLPETQLILGDAIHAGPVAALRAALAGGSPIRVALDAQLTTLETDQVAGWLSRITPAAGKLKPDGTKPHVIVSGPDSIEVPMSQGDPVWLVSQKPGAGDVDIRPLAPEDALPATGVFLLVNPSGFNLGGEPS